MSLDPLLADDQTNQTQRLPGEQRLTDWTIEPELTTLKQDMENALPIQREHIAKVNHWLDQLHIRGSAKLKPEPGRSRVQPKLIRKQAEWRYTALSEPFLSSDKLFSLSPRTWEDAEAARQNELVLNWQFDTVINRVSLVDQYVRKAVDEGTVVLQVSWVRETVLEEVEVPVFAYYPMNPEDPEDAQMVEQLSQLATQARENPGILRNLPPDLKASLEYSQEKGAPHFAQITGMERVTQEKVIKNHPQVELGAIHNLVIDPTCGAEYQKAMFMGYTMEMSRGALVADKRYKNLELVDWGRSPLAEPDHTPKGPPEFNFKDNSRQKITVTTYWGYFDIEGQGRLTPIVASWIGDVMIRCERNPLPDDLPPFVIVPLLPIVDSPYGEPDGALLEDNQKIIGAVTRGMVDIMARSANGQRGMAKSMLDTVNKRRFDAGHNYEFNPNVHPSQGIVEHKFPEIPQSAPFMLQLTNAEAESFTGVKTYGDQGLTGASLGPTAAGANAVTAATSRREMGILRRLAKGMADVGRKIVAMNQVFLSEEEVVRVTNSEFINVRREDLKGNFDLKVDISTAQDDETKAGRLEFMLQTVGPNGDFEMTQLMLAEIADLRRMPKLAHKIRQYQPQPDPLDQELKQLQIEELRAKIAKMNAEAAEHQAKAEKAQADARATHSEADMTDLKYVETDTGTTHARDVDKIATQANANARAKITEGILNQRNGSPTLDGKVDSTPTREDIHEAIAFNAQ